MSRRSSVKTTPVLGREGLKNSTADSRAFSKPLLLFGVLCLVAGQFSLERIGVSFFGLADVRILLVPCLALATFLRRATLFANGINRPLPRQARRWLWLLSLLHCYLILSATWSDVPLLAASEALNLLAALITVSCLIVVIAESPIKAVRFLFVCFFWIAAVYALGGLLRIGPPSPSGRMSAFGGGPNVFVRIMVTGIACAIYLPTITNRKLWLFAVPVFGVAVIFSGSRGGVLALILAALFSVFGLRRLLSRGRTRSLATFVLIATALVVAWAGVRVADYVEERYVQLTLRERYLSQRDIPWAHSLREFESSPLQGQGLASSFTPIGFEQELAYPHNLVLQVAADGGIVALILLGLVLAPLIRRRYSTYTYLELSVASFLARFFLIASLFSGGYFDARYLWIFVTIVILLAPGSRFRYW